MSVTAAGFGGLSQALNPTNVMNALNMAEQYNLRRQGREAFSKGMTEFNARIKADPELARIAKDTAKHHFGYEQDSQKFAQYKASVETTSELLGAIRDLQGRGILDEPMAKVLQKQAALNPDRTLHDLTSQVERYEAYKKQKILETQHAVAAQGVAAKAVSLGKGDAAGVQYILENADPHVVEPALRYYQQYSIAGGRDADATAAANKATAGSLNADDNKAIDSIVDIYRKYGGDEGAKALERYIANDPTKADEARRVYGDRTKAVDADVEKVEKDQLRQANFAILKSLKITGDMSMDDIEKKVLKHFDKDHKKAAEVLMYAREWQAHLRDERTGSSATKQTNRDLLTSHVNFTLPNGETIAEPGIYPGQIVFRKDDPVSMQINTGASLEKSWEFFASVGMTSKEPATSDIRYNFENGMIETTFASPSLNLPPMTFNATGVVEGDTQDALANIRTAMEAGEYGHTQVLTYLEAKLIDFTQGVRKAANTEGLSDNKKMILSNLVVAARGAREEIHLLSAKAAPFSMWGETPAKGEFFLPSIDQRTSEALDLAAKVQLRFFGMWAIYNNTMLTKPGL